MCPPKKRGGPLVVTTGTDYHWWLPFCESTSLRVTAVNISRGPDLYQEYLTKNISTKTISPGDPPNQEYFHQEYLTKNISTKNISLSHLVTHQEYLQMKSADSRRGNSCSIIEITSAFRKDFIDLKFKLKSHLSLEK